MKGCGCKWRLFSRNEDVESFCVLLRDWQIDVILGRNLRQVFWRLSWGVFETTKRNVFF